jgi:tRNA1(Val) A37 N6-methylase TrmN6
VDALILAAHASGRVRESALRRAEALEKKQLLKVRVADLGAGSGVVGIALALGGFPSGTNQRASLKRRTDDPHGFIEILSIERQSSLASRCARNVALNGLSDAATVCACDVRAILGAPFPVESEDSKATSRTIETWLGTCDAVVINPPYYEAGSKRAAGTLPRDPERRDAHYETTASLAAFARAAERLLRKDDSGASATAHFVYPADRAPAVISACTEAGLEDITVRNVFTDENERLNGAPVLALIDARRRRAVAVAQDAGTLFADPLVLYADEAKVTYGFEIETFMETLGA